MQTPPPQNKQSSDNLTPEKVKVYDLLSVVIIRFLFALSSIVGFFIVLAFFLQAENNFELTKYGIIEGLLAATVFLVWRYYFPRKK